VLLEIVRPETGSLTREELSGELADVCSEIAWDEDLRAVVLAYSGEVLRSLGPMPGTTLNLRPSFVECVADLKLPVIAAIEGDAVGPGLELALASDLRIGTEGARFGLPQVRSGSMPSDGGTQRLARFVGAARALELILLGETVDAAEAHRIGLLNRVVDPAALSATAAAMAREIASRSPVAVSYVKEALHKGLDLSLEQGIRMELDLYLLLFTTDHRTEGVSAFREKRAPKFEGK
jgi:enoyl-CoA hydratase/carnithine racemase